MGSTAFVGMGHDVDARALGKMNPVTAAKARQGGPRSIVAIQLRFVRWSRMCHSPERSPS